MHCYVRNNMVKGGILLAFAVSCILSMATTTCTNVGRKHLFIIIIEYTPTKVQDIYVTTDKVKVVVRKINHNVFE